MNDSLGRSWSELQSQVIYQLEELARDTEKLDGRVRDLEIQLAKVATKTGIIAGVGGAIGGTVLAGLMRVIWP